ncbi:MAG: hypothetical protein AAF622_16725 [Cyanobacteria bacterium P01_C01_bin.147]
MNNRQTLQIHRCLLAIAITLLLARTYAHPPASPEEMDLPPWR